MLKDSIARDLSRLDAKQDVMISMLTALIAQNSGGISAPPDTKSDEIGDATTAEIALLCSMTPKQHAAMLLCVSGWSNKEMADLMNVTDNTVKQHLRAVMKTLGVRTRGQVALAASDILGRMSASEYKKTSGGFPPTWAVDVNPEDDEYYPLYAPVRSTNV